MLPNSQNDRRDSGAQRGIRKKSLDSIFIAENISSVNVEVTPEFSTWFAALSADQAEEVATALDLLGADPKSGRVVASREEVLVFDGTRAGEVAYSAMFERRVCTPEVLRLMSSRQAEILRWIESQRFTARVWALGPAAIEPALRAVRRLWDCLQQLVTSAKDNHITSAASDEVDVRIKDVLRRLRVDPKNLPAAPNGLREIVLAKVEPALRIVYGVHPGGSIVALIGDALTRSYYGDSIRIAEQRFREFLAGPAASESAAP
jgi:hypothetical protein